MTEPSDQSLAGSAANEQRVPPPPPIEPREVFPVTMDKDYKDFRGVVDKDFSGQPVADQSDPKVLSAPESVGTLKSVTGLEDISEEDLANLVRENAEKVTNGTITTETRGI